jgi:hypothetical protein
MPTLNESDVDIAKIIAIYIRNGMEDFHCKNLSDAQMKELNPIIRNSIVTALHVMRHMADSEAAKKSSDFSLRCIPSYWEEPELLPDYVTFEKKFERP